MELDRKEVMTALQYLGHAIEKRDVVDFLSHVLLMPVPPTHLLLRTGNHEMFIEKKIKVNNLEKDFIPCCLPYNYLYGIASLAPGDNLTLIYQGTKNKATIKSHHHKSMAAVLSADSFPPAYNMPRFLTFSTPPNFWAAIALLKPFMASEQTRPEINGIQIEGDEKVLTLVATDGYAIGIAVLNWKEKKKVKVRIPGFVVKALMDVGENSESSLLGINENGSMAGVNFSDGTTITFSLLHGSFVNWRAAIKKYNDLKRTKLIIHHSSLLSSLERIHFLSTCQDSVAEPYIMMSGEKEKRIRLKAFASTVEGEEIVKCKGNTGGIGAQLNPKLLITALRAMKDNKKVQLEIAKDNTILALFDASFATYIALRPA